MSNCLVLTGFYPFGGYHENSSEILMDTLRWKQIAGFRVMRTLKFEATIPDYCRGDAVLEEAERIEASRIISFGMSSSARGFRIETKAKNLVNDARYCPNENGQPVDPSMPIGHVLTADLLPWSLEQSYDRMEEAGISVELSKEAGGFCCNHLMYQVLKLQRGLGTAAIPFMFIHIPCVEEAIAPERREQFLAEGKTFLPIEKVVEGLRIVLESAERIG